MDAENGRRELGWVGKGKLDNVLLGLGQQLRWAVFVLGICAALATLGLLAVVLRLGCGLGLGLRGETGST